MFKFWLYIALCISLIYYSYSTNSNPQLEFLGAGELCIYSSEDIQSPFVKRRVETGIGYIYYIDSSTAFLVRPLFTTIDGESITLYDSRTAESVLTKLGYMKVGRSNDGVMDVVYAYSAKNSTHIISDDQKVNLQVAVRDGIVTVGWPVILGSY